MICRQETSLVGYSETFTITKTKTESQTSFLSGDSFCFREMLNRPLTPTRKRTLSSLIPQTVPIPKTPERPQPVLPHIDDSRKHSSFRVRLLELENSLKLQDLKSTPVTSNDAAYNSYLKSLTTSSPQHKGSRPETVPNPLERSEANTVCRDSPEDVLHVGNWDRRRSNVNSRLKTFERSETLLESLPVPSHCLFSEEG
ncbi:hypothetical protein GEMRC1_010613 [Eukaryota sp. GEM-RC1]